MKKIAIVYMAHDGFTSLYTGVGTVARDFLLSFPQVCENLHRDFKNLDFGLFVTTIKYNSACFGYSEDVKRITEEFVNKYKNIHLVELINGSAGTKSYGSTDLWKNACISAATFLYSLIELKDYDKIIVICVDTPFGQVANYFFDQYSYKNIEFVWLPQSTVLIHKIDSGLGKSLQHNNYIEERFAWEKAIIDLAKRNKQVKIGFIGEYMKKHLLTEYKAQKNSLISIQNSLFFNRLKENVIAQEKIPFILKSLGVPLDRPLLFSFGRAEPYKGLDLVVKNSFKLIEGKNYFVLILASPYFMDDPYVAELNELVKNRQRDIKIIYGLDFLTPHYIMQWRNTKILALLSRAEPFGLIPTESRFYRNSKLSLITSDLGGYQEQVVEGVDGFKTKLDDKSINLKFGEVANLGVKQKAKMTKNGHDRVIKDYNQIKVNSDFIRKYLVGC